MSIRHTRRSPAGREMPAAQPSPAAGPAEILPGSVPERACCCSAKPAVRAILPPAESRLHPADLWFCGHHWRTSREALLATGAAIQEVPLAASAPDAARSGVAA